MNEPRSLEPAQQALTDLIAAAGLSSEVPTLDIQTDGEVPLSCLDWLIHACRDNGPTLVNVEARLEEIPEWLEREVPLLTAIEGVPGSDLQEAPATRWMVLRRGENGTVEVGIHDAEGSRAETLTYEELGSHLGLDRGGIRALRVELSPVSKPARGGTPQGQAPLPPLKRLGAILRPDRRDLVAVALFAVAVGVMLLATPIAVQALVNFVALGGAIPPLIVIMLLLFLGLFFAGVMTAMQTWVVEIIQRRIFVRAVSDISARLPRVALADGKLNYGPELVNRYFDLETIQKRGSFLLLDGLAVLLSVTIGLILLAFYHPLLLAFDILLLAAIFLIVLGPIRKGIKTAMAESSAKYAMAAWLEEIARNPILFKSSGVMKTVFERSDQLAKNYVMLRKRHFRIAFGQGVAAIVLQIVASTATLGIGGFLVIQGSLTLGQLVAAELIVAVVVNSVAKMGKHIEAFYDLMAATAKVGVLLDLPVERTSGEHHLPAVDSKGSSLKVEQLSWSRSSGAPLLSKVSMSVAPGERIGICGPSGSGKSTLLRLVWGMLEPNHGSIEIDGRDLRELSLESLRRTTLLVDRVELLEGTLRDNIQLARYDIHDDDVREALRKVGLLSDVSRLKDGVDTSLRSYGRPLSSGQSVKLQVARAIASRPRLLLVSDFFEELGEQERQVVFDALFDPQGSWTLIFVTNNNEVLERCGRTYCLEESTLRELGSADSTQATVTT